MRAGHNYGRMGVVVRKGLSSVVSMRDRHLISARCAVGLIKGWMEWLLLRLSVELLVIGRGDGRCMFGVGYG